MTEIERQPKGDPQVRTVLMPAGANGRVATVAVDAMTFHKPVRIGDILCCHASLARVGRTSLAFDIEAWSIAAGVYREERVLVTEGRYTFVAIDTDGKPRPVDEEK